MKKHKCIDCEYCDLEQKKCFPQSKDCSTEYNLSDKDIYYEEKCDFFKCKD